MEHKATYTVKRLRLLQYLKEKGFTKYTVIPDPTTSEPYNWFVFQNSEELEAALNEYFKNLKH